MDGSAQTNVACMGEVGIALPFEDLVRRLEAFKCLNTKGTVQVGTEATVWLVA